MFAHNINFICSEAYVVIRNGQRHFGRRDVQLSPTGVGRRAAFRERRGEERDAVMSSKGESMLVEMTNIACICIQIFRRLFGEKIV